MNRTLAIIKPDAFAAGKAGDILAHLQQAGFRLIAAKVLHMTAMQARAFYAVHSERPFYNSLVEFMTSGPCMPLALERSEAVPFLRTTMGATDPAKADEGTVRKRFATSIEKNAIHGSDSAENAEKELAFFFSQVELAGAG
jgi:nucleoside-diphosphate kinase